MLCSRDFGQPIALISMFLPDFSARLFSMRSSAEYAPGTGCCRFPGILMTSFWPKILLPLMAEILAGRAWATPLSLIVPLSFCCSRKNASWFLPATKVVTLKFNGPGLAECGFSTASALPVPASDAVGQEDLPWLLSLETEQVFRPFVESTSVFGKRISICFAEVWLSLLLTIVSSRRADFGFFLVPALDGETLAVTSRLGDGRWA